MKGPILKKLSQFDQPMSKRGIVGSYTICVMVMAAGMVILSKPLWTGAPLSLYNALIGFAITLGGALLGLCVFYRHKIPLRVKLYLGFLAFTIGGIWMIADAEDISSRDYRHWSATAIRIMGTVCVLFFGGGGFFVLYKDIKYHWEHRNDVYTDSNDKTTLTEGVIRIKGYDEETIKDSIEQFNKQGAAEIKADLKRFANHLLLVLHAIDYDSFCLLFNSMVYREKFNADYSVRGWLTNCQFERNGIDIKGSIMFFIPEDDTAYDNVYFMTFGGDCYKQEFSGSQKLKKVDCKGIRFELPK